MQPAAVAGQAAVRADDAVAGHDDADRVLAVGESGGADRSRFADSPRQLGVTDGFAALDLAQRLPDALLEGRTAGLHRQLADCLGVALDVAPHGGGESTRVARRRNRVAVLAVVSVEQA